MAKRFTETTKWADEWFSELEPAHKLIWIYLCDNCTIGGRWKKTFKQLNFNCGTALDEKEFITVFNDKLVDCESFYFIPSFLRFQYPQGLNSMKPAIVAVRNELSQYPMVIEIIKERLSNNYLIITKPLNNGCLTVKDKDMDKDKDKDKDKALLLGNAKEEKKPRNSRAKKQTVINPDVQEIFDHWNRLKVVIHSDISKFIPPIEDRLRFHSKKIIMETMDNLERVISSPDYWWTYKYDLYKFLTHRENGFDCFLTVNRPFEKYRKQFNGKKESTPATTTDRWASVRHLYPEGKSDAYIEMMERRRVNEERRKANTQQS